MLKCNHVFGSEPTIAYNSKPPSTIDQTRTDYRSSTDGDQKPLMMFNNMREASPAHLSDDLLAAHAEWVSFQRWKLTFLRRTFHFKISNESM